MMPVLWLASALFTGGDSIPVASASIDAAAPPIRIWINNSRQFREGERAQVQVESRDDGYLLVFNYDTEGRLRVLFPVDPREDNFVRGGRRYEVRGRGDRESFVVGRDGDGLIYASVSADPFRFDDIEVGGNWDYDRISIGDNSRDPESDITELLQRISTNRGFDYDVLDYRVYGYRSVTVANNWWHPRPYGYFDDYYCDPWNRPSLFGCRSYPVGGWYGGYGSGYYGYNDYGYGGYGDGGGWGYGGWGRNGYRNPRYYGGAVARYPVLAGRPRGYTIVRRGNDNTGNAAPGRSGSFGGGSLGGGGRRPVIDYRPRTPGGRPADGDRVFGGRPSGDRVTPNVDMDRPRGRRSPTVEERGPIVERDRGTPRGPVDFGDRPARRATDGGNDNGRRVEPRESRPEVRERPRNDDRPRNNDGPRNNPPPRVDPPRQSAPPAAQPRNNDAPRRPRERPPA